MLLLNFLLRSKTTYVVVIDGSTVDTDKHILIPMAFAYDAMSVHLS